MKNASYNGCQCKECPPFFGDVFKLPLYSYTGTDVGYFLCHPSFGVLVYPWPVPLFISKIQ